MGAVSLGCSALGLGSDLLACGSFPAASCLFCSTVWVNCPLTSPNLFFLEKLSASFKFLGTAMPSLSRIAFSKEARSKALVFCWLVCSTLVACASRSCCLGSTAACCASAAFFSGAGC